MLDYLVNPDIEDYCHQNTTKESDLLLSLIEATNKNMGYPVKLSGRQVGRLLKLIVSISQTKTILEIGMFTGYSALSMAEALPDDGKIICCETNPRAVEFAKAFFEQSPHGDKIDIRFGKALDTIGSFSDITFDLVFIDADKKNYTNYLHATLPLVRKGGLVIVDNALWQGNVLAPSDERDQAVADLNHYVAESDALENVLLSIRDGVNIIRKC
ncbi:class I SAM-dependent methyltransferase [Zooshikella marina]|uniref:Methyltransferase n=1 Tax=Zooshikella ganghwensis TaxID=202772 RepID=A0A4V1INB3_9GAMM|nr:O-methyltransferase [Zooshikella ganghwensis]MBU2704650.1 class I SAM-dependent methyltransferase [Zooshikella ganghwensis]RDH43131.1 methyltransferase [Zooshikella ganghwensis]